MADHDEKGDGHEEHGGEDHGGGGKEKGGHKKKGHGGGHGAHPEHEEGVPEWMISFADNALLQMGLFVIMFAMNVGEKATGPTAPGDEKGVSPGMADTVLSIRDAFNNPVSPNSTDPKDAPLVKRLKERKEQGEAQENGVKGEKQNVQATRPTGFTNITATVGFEQGVTTLSNESRAILADAAKKLKGQRWIVEIRGHCSSIEAADGPTKAYEISHQRAMAAAAALAESGVSWNQLRITANADSARLTPLAFDSGQHRSNQRVELIVTNDAMPADPYAKEPGK